MEVVAQIPNLWIRKKKRLHPKLCDDLLKERERLQMT